MRYLFSSVGIYCGPVALRRGLQLHYERQYERLFLAGLLDRCSARLCRGRSKFCPRVRDFDAQDAGNGARHTGLQSGRPFCLAPAYRSPTHKGGGRAGRAAAPASGGLPGDQGIQAVIDGGQALQNYIANATTILGTGKERILSAYVSGDTGIAIPGAPSAISIALGYETRETTTDYRPDLANRTGDRSGAGGAALALKGGYDVD